ncbi:MAG: glycosyltransferase family 4 protein [Deltaproteobacteria bacterium]|nr:glycosyltransferase family 4 protein [Deltaproteobacteria bacterium]
MAEIRLAYLVTHPIQYQAPLLRRLAREPGIDLTVFFCSDFSAKQFLDPTFGRVIEWDVPLLEGYRYEILPALGDRDRVSFFRPLSYGLAKRLREGGFQVLWIHGYNRWFHWLAMWSAKRLGLKVLIRDEATLISAPRSYGKRLLKQGFFAGLGRLADGFLAIGSLNKAYYRHYGLAEERIFAVPYAVDNAFFQAGAERAAGRREELRRELGLEAGRPVILFVSKIEPRKRPADLLAAYIKLLQSGAVAGPPYLLFVGDGEQRGPLEEVVRQMQLDPVRFLGFKNQSELPAYYDLCEVLVLPSVFEPWGLVVNEVMNAGRAVIVSDQVGCGPDLVRNGENGYIFPAGDRAALAELLRKVLAEPAVWRAMGARSREIISQWSFAEDLSGLRQALSAVVEKT